MLFAFLLLDFVFRRSVVWNVVSVDVFSIVINLSALAVLVVKGGIILEIIGAL
jgi:hypothetical protein